jgi:hypothetical protein
MSDTKSSRRRFIKTAVVGATGLAISPRVMCDPPSSAVNISFDGMMVFHKFLDDYEVGIVDEPVAKGHVFSIMGDVGQIFTQVLKLRAQAAPPVVRIDVKKNGKPKKELKSIKEGHSNRMQDDLDGQYDLDWLVDFESREFHRNRLVADGQGGVELPMEPGNLRFVIRMSCGQIYTKHKIAKLSRWPGIDENGAVVFGFLTETVGFQINLKPNEVVVLSCEGQEHTIPYKAGETTSIELKNAIPVKERGPASHFSHYYYLFPRVPPEERYDIKLKEPKEYPYNHYPIEDNRIITTVGDYPCGPIYLGKREKALV